MVFIPEITATSSVSMAATVLSLVIELLLAAEVMEEDNARDVLATDIESASLSDSIGIT